jgi:carbamoyl-phosphate synthase large subunit
MINKSRKINVLITCVGGEYGSEIILRFKKNKFVKKINIIGTDTKDLNDVVASKFLDKFYKVPKTNNKFFLKKIDEIVKKNKINFILVTSDEESLLLSKRYHNTKIQVACSDFDVLKKLSNKIETYKLLEKNNINLPLWYEIKNEKDIAHRIKFFEKKKLEFCLKPAVSRGGRDVVVINNKLKKILSFQNSRERHVNIKDFKSNYKLFFKNKYPLLMMEKLKTPVYDLDILSNNGNVISSVCRRRLHSALPNKGHVIIKNKYLESLAKKISKIFQLNYLHDCDLMMDENNNFKILEINPRPSGSFVVAEAAGFPLIENMLKIYFGIEKFSKPSKIFKRILPYQSLASFSKI